MILYYPPESGGRVEQPSNSIKYGTNYDLPIIRINEIDFTNLTGENITLTNSARVSNIIIIGQGVQIVNGQIIQIDHSIDEKADYVDYIIGSKVSFIEDYVLKLKSIQELNS